MISAAEARKKGNALAAKAGSVVSERRRELNALVAGEMKSIELAIKHTIEAGEKSINITDTYGCEVHIYMWMQRGLHGPPPTSSKKDYTDNLAIDALNIILSKLRKKGFKCESDFVNSSHLTQCLKISW